MFQQIIKFSTRYIPRHYLHLFVHLIFRIISVFFKGNNFEDPIDGRKYRKLLPYGRIKTRNNVLAPGSLSLERHRLIWLFLKTKTDFFSAKHEMLHIAPEYCFIKPIKKLKNIRYTTADLNSPWADIHLDVQKMPFADNSFDIVMCNHVLEHVDNDMAAMKEICRVLKPGGWAILHVPIDLTREKTYEDKHIKKPSEREKHFGQSDHQRVYGKDYPDRLTKAGFKVLAFDLTADIDKALAVRFALPPGEIIYQCFKQ